MVNGQPLDGGRYTVEEQLGQGRFCLTYLVDDLIDVNVPIRIGEYRQLNDGVIGYWKEQKNFAGDTGYGYEHNIFYAQQSDVNESDKIETQFIDPDTNPEVEEGAINIIQYISSPWFLNALRSSFRLARFTNRWSRIFHKLGSTNGRESEIKNFASRSPFRKRINLFVRWRNSYSGYFSQT